MMTRADIIKALEWHPAHVEAGPQSLLVRIERVVAQAVAQEQDRCCKIVYGMAGSDNVAQRTVDAIRGKE